MTRATLFAIGLCIGLALTYHPAPPLFCDERPDTTAATICTE